MGAEFSGSYSDVAKYKFEQARDDLEAAEILWAAGKYKAANNHAYYSCYHAVDAVLALEPVAPGIKQNADRIAGKIKHTPGQGTEKVPVWGYCYLPVISSYSLNLLHCSVIMRMSARA